MQEAVPCKLQRAGRRDGENRGAGGKTPASRLRKALPLTQTRSRSPRSKSPGGQRGVPRDGAGVRVAPCVGSSRVRHCANSGALGLAGRALDPPGPPTSLLCLGDENFPNPAGLASDSPCSHFLATSGESPTEEEAGNWAQSLVGLSLSARLWFRPLSES